MTVAIQMPQPRPGHSGQMPRLHRVRRAASVSIIAAGVAGAAAAVIGMALLSVVPGTARAQGQAPGTAGGVAGGDARLPAPTTDDCDRPEHELLLVEEHTSTSETLYRLPARGSPDGQGGPAQAVWLDDLSLRWPGSPPPGTVRHVLAHSARASMRVELGRPVTGAATTLTLRTTDAASPDAAGSAASAQRWRHLAAGVDLRLPELPVQQRRDLHVGQLVLAALDGQNRVLQVTRTQQPGALDALYAEAESVDNLGVTIEGGRGSAARTAWRLWAPTAAQVAVCLYPGVRSPAEAVRPLARDWATGVWQGRESGDLSGHVYTYLVDVFIPSRGWIRNRVTDPYAVSLTADSMRSAVLSLDDPALMPDGWAETGRPDRVRSASDRVIYGLHVRDFSANDPTVRLPYQGKYLAFTLGGSDGIQHLRRLARAGVTDVHLMPVSDFAAVPETGCRSPMGLTGPGGPPDSDFQQARVMEVANRDCFNWGFDPFHFNAPEGSYATDAEDPAVRVRELRAMVQALHRLDLRVGMDVVYDRTTAAGQHPKSVLDRVVPGYYQRLRADGAVETSACCDSTALEHRMMAKLMVDSVVLWAREHRIDGFRFNHFGQQPRETLVRLQKAVDAAAGRRIHLIGHAEDEVGLAASQKRQVRSLVLAEIGFSGPAASQGEAANTVDSRDDRTLFDSLAMSLPETTSREDRARMQVLGMAVSAFSQGAAYFPAGIEMLRSKSGDRNSHDSGDWFNRLDWSLTDNFWATGLPPERSNARDWPLLKQRLASPLIKPQPAQIRFSRDAFEDLLRIRASSRMLRLPTADEVSRRLTMLDTGPAQVPTLVGAHVDGQGLEGAGFQAMAYFINAGTSEAVITDERFRAQGWVLHPVHRAAGAADQRPLQQARLDAATGRVTVPARTAMVWVRP